MITLDRSKSAKTRCWRLSGKPVQLWSSNMIQKWTYFGSFYLGMLSPRSKRYPDSGPPGCPAGPILGPIWGPWSWSPREPPFYDTLCAGVYHGVFSVRATNYGQKAKFGAQNRFKRCPGIGQKPVQKWTPKMDHFGVSIWDPLDVMFWRGFDPSEWTIWGIELPYKGIWSLRMVAGPGIRDPFWTPKWSILDHFWGLFWTHFLTQNRSKTGSPRCPKLRFRGSKPPKSEGNPAHARARRYIYGVWHL